MQDRKQTLEEPDKVARGIAGEFWLVVALALACALFLGSQRLQYSDDAYITFRHVKNMLEHGRPAWNLGGDPVLGSTSPAFLFALALFCKVVGSVQVDHAAFSLNVVFHFLTVIFCYLIGKDLFGRVLPSALLALLVGLNSITLYVFSQGFESAMLAAVLVAGLYFVCTGRDGLSLVLASLAPLVRPEGILITPLVWGYIVAKKRFKKKLLPAYFLIPLIWVVFSTAYYGSPVPHPIVAKKKFPMIHRPYGPSEVSLTRRLPNILSYAFDLWHESAGPLLLTGKASNEQSSTVQKCRGWIMLMGLPLAVWRLIVRREGRFIYVLYGPLFLLLYGWLGHTKPWYFPSFVTLSLLLLFGGWMLAIDRISGRAENGSRSWIRRWKVGQVLSLAVFIVFVTANRYSLNRGEDRHATRGLLFPPDPGGSLWHLWGAQRYNRYREVAEYLNARGSQPGAAMISEVGCFGYFYEGDVIDTVGLCSPEALAFYPPPAEDIRDAEGNDYTRANNFTPTNMVMTLKPDYVVNSRYFMANLLRPGSPFLKEYHKIAEGRPVYGEPILIYERR